MVNSLQTLNAQLRERYQRAAPPATPATAWGSIADGEHDEDSDHYPHFYAALGKTAVVCARDFPHAASLGMDAGPITEALRLSRDSRLVGGYVIFAGRVFSGHVVNGVPAFTWRKYTGKDGHWTHFHVSVGHTVAADNGAPWQLPGDAPAPMTGDDMELGEPVGWAKQFIDPTKDYGLWLGGTVGNQLQYIRETSYFAWLAARSADQRIAALTSVIETLADVIKAGGGDVDTAGLYARIDAAVAKAGAEARDAVDDGLEGGAAQVRADAD